MKDRGPSSENRERGYIRLYRSQFDVDDPLWKQSGKKSYWEAWQYVLSLAHYREEPSAVLVRGRVVEVRRGEFVISQRELAERLGWGRQEVRTFLRRLQDLSRIEPASQPNVGHYKLCNYEFYNDTSRVSNPRINPPPNPMPARHQPNVNPPPTLSKKGKGEEHEEPESNSKVDTDAAAFLDSVSNLSNDDAEALLSKHGAEDILRVKPLYERRQAKGGLSNPGGFVRKALEEGWANEQEPGAEIDAWRAFAKSRKDEEVGPSSNRRTIKIDDHGAPYFLHWESGHMEHPKTSEDFRKWLGDLPGAPAGPPDNHD